MQLFSLFLEITTIMVFVSLATPCIIMFVYHHVVVHYDAFQWYWYCWDYWHLRCLPTPSPLELSLFASYNRWVTPPHRTHNLHQPNYYMVHPCTWCGSPRLFPKHVIKALLPKRKQSTHLTPRFYISINSVHSQTITMHTIPQHNHTQHINSFKINCYSKGPLRPRLTRSL